MSIEVRKTDFVVIPAAPGFYVVEFMRSDGPDGWHVDYRPVVCWQVLTDIGMDRVANERVYDSRLVPVSPGFWGDRDATWCIAYNVGGRREHFGGRLGQDGPYDAKTAKEVMIELIESDEKFRERQRAKA